MDIHIECVAGDPPTWKVFWGKFFWPCATKEDAEAWAENANAHMVNCNPGYRLPSPLPPPRGPRHDAGTFPHLSYIEDAATATAARENLLK